MHLHTEDVQFAPTGQVDWSVPVHAPSISVAVGRHNAKHSIHTRTCTHGHSYYRTQQYSGSSGRQFTDKQNSRISY